MPALPTYNTLQVVAKHRDALFETEALDRRVHLIAQQLDADAAGGGGGKVEHQFATGEDQRLRNQLASAQRRLQRREAVDAQCIAPQAGALAAPVAFVEVDRQFVRRAGKRRARSHYAPVLMVVAVGPVVDRAQSRPDKGFLPQVEVVAVAAAHEQAVGDRGAVTLDDVGAHTPVFQLRQVLMRFRPGTFDIPCWKAQQDVRGAEVRPDLIGVELIGSAFAVADIDRVGPVNVIGRACGEDVAAVARPAYVCTVSALPCGCWMCAVGFLARLRQPELIALVGPVLAARPVPEGQVLRVKRAEREDGTVAHLLPVNSVWRAERPQPSLAAPLHQRQRFIALLGPAGWVAVLERGE